MAKLTVISKEFFPIVCLLIGKEIKSSDKKILKDLLFTDAKKYLVDEENVIEQKMNMINRIIGGHGYNIIRDNIGGINNIEYINRGEPYTKTIIRYRNEWFWSDWGNLVEFNWGCYTGE